MGSTRLHSCYSPGSLHHYLLFTNITRTDDSCRSVVQDKHDGSQHNNYWLLLQYSGPPLPPPPLRWPLFLLPGVAGGVPITKLTSSRSLESSVLPYPHTLFLLDIITMVSLRTVAEPAQRNKVILLIFSNFWEIEPNNQNIIIILHSHCGCRAGLVIYSLWPTKWFIIPYYWNSWTTIVSRIKYTNIIPVSCSWYFTTVRL